MNRREFVVGALGLVLGGGAVTLLRQEPAPGIQPGTLERQLIDLVRPESAALQEMFPAYPDYESTVAELHRRGLVRDGALYMQGIEQRRKTDPVIEFNGWQHLESEVLVMLAAYQLAGHRLVVNDTASSVSFERYDVMGGTDSVGEAIGSYRIDTPNDYSGLSTCLDLCDAEPRCRNISYATSSHPIEAKANVCWLATDDVRRTANPFYFSASKKP